MRAALDNAAIHVPKAIHMMVTTHAGAAPPPPPAAIHPGVQIISVSEKERISPDVTIQKYGRYVAVIAKMTEMIQSRQVRGGLAPGT